ncbi:MAG: prohibitin family protein, partial [Sphingobacteriales bacterium]
MLGKIASNVSAPSPNGGRLVILIIAVALIISLAMQGFYTVSEGYRAVILRNGSLVGTAEPGFGLKIPFMDTVVKISVRDNIARLELPTYSFDQQLATTRISISYRIMSDKVDEAFSRYGGEQGVVERLINPKATEGFKETFGKFTASLAIQEREKLGADVNTRIIQNIEGPVVITSVQIENIDFK